MVHPEELRKIYRKDHITIAQALRDASEDAQLSDDQRGILVKYMSEACSARTPKDAQFDRGLFYAYALSPSLPRE